ncbi:DUF177 domain-containing protein [Telmatospirillum sp.]|uniref:YceD family protein n=1 Tax=Telmatospirillum sp. TaxID=2079197 RepID=UPI00284315A6|nr:DUF177 domain-containing protein [Telmatospirillum sp.]MDR3440838.1 DUF177 domain-containing protein [Telmatospirillum sp.]
MIPLELSRPVQVDRLGHEERSYDIEATTDECAALARRYDILAVARLSARVRLRRLPGGKLFRLSGRFSADVSQSCVVTLAPVPAHLEEEFILIYTMDRPEEGDEVIIDLDAEDPPEVIENGAIDIGEAVAEHLALALDPFPRVDGAVFHYDEAPPIEETPKVNPFATLASLKKK